MSTFVIYFAEMYSFRFDAYAKISGLDALAMASDAIYVFRKRRSAPIFLSSVTCEIRSFNPFI